MCKIHFAPKSCVLLYWQCYCTALEQWAPAKLCGVQQRAPHVLGRAAIRLGIGPHSSYIIVMVESRMRGRRSLFELVSGLWVTVNACFAG